MRCAVSPTSALNVTTAAPPISENSGAGAPVVCIGVPTRWSARGMAARLAPLEDETTLDRAGADRFPHLGNSLPAAYMGVIYMA